MTLDEKIASLGTSGVAVPRLGIRGTAIGEALSGVVLGGPMQTILAAFPDVPPEARTLPTPRRSSRRGRPGAHLGSGSGPPGRRGDRLGGALHFRERQKREGISGFTDAQRGSCGDPRWAARRNPTAKTPSSAAPWRPHSSAEFRRQPQVLAGGQPAQALPGQQQRTRPLRLVVGLRCAADARVVGNHPLRRTPQQLLQA